VGQKVFFLDIYEQSKIKKVSFKTNFLDQVALNNKNRRKPKKIEEDQSYEIMMKLK
jgi:hypothetical protein